MIKNYLNQVIILVLISSHIQAQNCESSRADIDFHPNNVRTKLGLAGSIWDFEYKALMEGTLASEQSNLLYAGNIWLGGLDQEDNLHLAGGI